MARRRLPRWARIGLWSLVGLVVLLVAGGGILALTFDPDSFKPRVVAAVKRATGRDLVMNGRIHLGLSLQPTLVVQDVSLANPPGFSRPQMATLERLDLKLALFPLLSHRVEISRLVLVKPDIILETDAQGRPNWQFKPEAGPATPQPAAADEPHEGTKTSISASEVRVENGTLTWRDGHTGQSAVFAISSLRVTTPSPDANMSLAMAATYNGTPFNLTGEFGPLTQLEAPTGNAAWPVKAELQAAGAKVSVDGSVAQVLQGRGYTMKLAASVPDLAGLAPLLPGVDLPPLHDVKLAAQVADSGGPLPDVSSLTLHVGPSDLSGRVAGLKLDKLDIDAARLDQPVHVAAQGSFGNTPATLTGTMGAPAALLPGAKPAAPIPIDVSLQGLGSSLSIKGTATQGAGGRPAVQAELTAAKIDGDALAAAVHQAPKRPAAATPSAPQPPKSDSNRWLIPDTPIPFGPLRLADADVKLKIDQLLSGGVTYRAIAAHVVLQNGKLRLDPLAVDTPDGHIDVGLSADATQPTPPVTLRLDAPALVMQRLLATFGEPAWISGSLQVHADLRGAGATPHAIASTLDGTVGLAMANGVVDNRLLGSTLGSVLREINLLDLVGRGGTSQVHCLAARLDASHGVAAVRSLVFASSLLTMDGDGSINLGNETLDLRLRPQAKVVATAVVVPMRLSGPIRSPTAKPDPAAAVVENAGTVAGTMLGTATPLGIVAGALGGQKLLGGTGGADCSAALAAARGQPGAPAPVAQPARPAQPAIQPKVPNIGNTLKQLFR